MVAAEAKVLNDLGLFDTLQTRFHQDVTTAGLSLDMVGGTITPLQLGGMLIEMLGFSIWGFWPKCAI